MSHILFALHALQAATAKGLTRMQHTDADGDRHDNRPLPRVVPDLDQVLVVLLDVSVVVQALVAPPDAIGQLHGVHDAGHGVREAACGGPGHCEHHVQRHVQGLSTLLMPICHGVGYHSFCLHPADPEWKLLSS